jgi:choline dehydrogenase-like flavoprotein
MNPQSRGSLKLQSANPEDPPLIDMSYLTHPYDRRSLIKSVRRAMQVPKTKTISKYWKAPINIPKSESDEDIWVGTKTLVSVHRWLLTKSLWVDFYQR